MTADLTHAKVRLLKPLSDAEPTAPVLSLPLGQTAVESADR
jgi:hypothetical protein